jgi:hypothetical protein
MFPQNCFDWIQKSLNCVPVITAVRENITETQRNLNKTICDTNIEAQGIKECTNGRYINV